MVKRWLAGLGITAYVGTLLFGIVSHAANYRDGSHPSMYFIVWDMFCGWSAYETRTHIVGQGVSGKFYELSPGPWSDYHPYGNISRHNYDSFNLHPHAIALNCLRHTDHEPMTRLYVVEESWAKKYNLPDAIWQQRYSEPKEPYSYFRLRTVMTAEGRVTQSYVPWMSYQTGLTITDNPRLLAESQNGPMYMVRPMTDPSYQPSEAVSESDASIAAPVGN